MRVITLVCTLLLLSGCIVLSDTGGQQLQVAKDAEGTFVLKGPEVVQSAAQVLKALVKGSIYESGETVSVFGTCLDADDMTINSTYGVLSAWYPNGTAYLTNVTMTEIQQGYYLYTGPMNAVQGTYLTELTCHINGSSQLARAFGEWQNPYWVARINDTQQAVANLTITIGDLAINISNSFEITWDKIESVNTTVNNVYSNLSNEIYIVGQIANNSVDRNDSYIVQLILNLTNLVSPGSPGDPTNWTEDAEIPVYMKTWSIKVYPYYGPSGNALSFPDVTCDIQTDLPSDEEEMTVEGNHFKYSIKITRVGDFNWFVNCYWL